MEVVEAERFQLSVEVEDSVEVSTGRRCIYYWLFP